MITAGSLQSNESPSWISLYFHIPFCKKKCPYCHFYVIPSQEKLFSHYIDTVMKEWYQKMPLLKGRTIYSLYFGGGTPSQLPASYVARLLDGILSAPVKLHPQLEITFEANPEDLSENYLKELKNTPINRLSMGVQSLHNPSLHLLGRGHNASRAVDAIFLADSLGFDNISIDLMYDIPHQTLSSWEHTLQSLKRLPISHLSLYNLTFEPHTVFYKQKHKLLQSVPSDQESVQLLQHGIDSLASLGLDRYEISAFAKPGKHSKHNTGYWLGREFLGFGPSAFSYCKKRRFRNHAHLKKYTDCIEQELEALDFTEQLDEEASLRELLIVRLRLAEGVDLNLFPPLPKRLLQEVKTLQQQGLLKQKERTLYLTQQGMLFYDTVAETLV